MLPVRMIATNAGSEIRYLFVAVFVYSVLLAPIGLLYAEIDTSSLIAYLQLASILSFYHYWRMTRWGAAKYTSFGGALILFAIMFRAMAIIDSLAYGFDYLKWPSTLPIYGSLEWLFIQGEIITQLGFLLTIVAWRMAVFGSLMHLSLRPKPWSTEDRAKLLKLYWAALVITGVFSFTTLDLGGLKQLIAGVIFLGVAAIYLYAAGCASRWQRASMAVLLGLPLAYVAMASGSKEAIFMPFVPSFLLAWRDFNRVAARTLMITAIFGVLAIGMLYANYVRINLWNKQEESAGQIVSAVFASITPVSFIEALEHSFMRTNYAMAHAITMAVIERSGFDFENVYATVPAAFIPRLLWPDKPSMMPGAAHTRRIYGTNKNLEDMNTATAPGLFAEMYLGGGMVMLLMSAMAYGALVGRLQVYFLHRLPPLATALFAYRLLYLSIRFDEIQILYAYNGIILYAITLIITMRILYPRHQPGQRMSSGDVLIQKTFMQPVDLRRTKY